MSEVASCTAGGSPGHCREQESKRHRQKSQTCAKVRLAVHLSGHISPPNDFFGLSSSTSSRFRLCTQRPRTAARICYRLSSGGHWATSRLVADANVRLWHLNPRLISVQVCFRDCLRNELQAEPP